MPQIITPEEYEKIKNSLMQVHPYSNNIEKTFFKKFEICMMLDFCYYIGLRPDTIRKIEMNHINFKQRSFFVPKFNIKTREAETFYFPEFLFRWLLKYLRIRCRMYKGSRFLFPSDTQSGILDKWTLSKIFRRKIKLLGISHLNYIDQSGYKRMDKNLYSLRHSFGTRVYEKTRSIKDTAIALGQKDRFFRCAAIYVHLCEKQERKAIINNIYGF